MSSAATRPPSGLETALFSLAALGYFTLFSWVFAASVDMALWRMLLFQLASAGLLFLVTFQLLAPWVLPGARRWQMGLRALLAWITILAVYFAVTRVFAQGFARAGNPARVDDWVGTAVVVWLHLLMTFPVTLQLAHGCVWLGAWLLRRRKSARRPNGPAFGEDIPPAEASRE